MRGLYPSGLTIDDFKPGTNKKFSRAEFLVYEEFELLARQYDLFCIYSYRLESHPSKRQGEIDYLVISQNLGIIALEVKGSRIKKDPNGIFHAFDRSKSEWARIQDPFKQAEENSFALLKTLQEILTMLRKRPLITWGCIFPENTDVVTGLDVPRWRYLDQEQFLSNLYPCLQEIAVRERNKGQQRFDELSDADIHAIVKNLVGLPFEGQPQDLGMSKGLRQLADLTAAQERLLLDLSENPRVFFTGAAGTGKTYLSVKEYKRLTDRGLRVGLVMPNEHLRRWALSMLGDGHPEASAHIKTYSAMVTGPDRERPFDVLIVDEAQDLLYDGRLQALSVCVSSGLAAGQWRLFGDPLRQAIFSGEPDIQKGLAANGISSTSVTQFKLRTNVRNTKRITQGLKKAVDLSDTDILENDYTGEKIELLIYFDGELLTKINRTVARLLEEGHPPHRLSIILPKEILAVTAQGFDFDYYPISDPEAFLGLKGITVGNEEDLKGLENDLIIYILPQKSDPANKQRIYIGMSRARLRLSILSHISKASEYAHIIKIDE